MGQVDVSRLIMLSSRGEACERHEVGGFRGGEKSASAEYQGGGGGVGSVQLQISAGLKYCMRVLGERMRLQGNVPLEIYTRVLGERY